MSTLESPLSLHLVRDIVQGYCLPGFFPEGLIIRSVSALLLAQRRYLVSSASSCHGMTDLYAAKLSKCLVPSMVALADASSSQPSTVAQGQSVRPWEA